MMRRFWVVLALGALTYEVEHRQLELDELVRQAEREGGVARGLDQARLRIDEARDRRAILLELLPHGTPDDWVAIGSAPLFDEYERKLKEIGQKLDPALREEDIPLLRRQIEAICPVGAPPFRPSEVPALTEDRKAMTFGALVDQRLDSARGSMARAHTPPTLTPPQCGECRRRHRAHPGKGGARRAGVAADQ